MHITKGKRPLVRSLVALTLSRWYCQGCNGGRQHSVSARQSWFSMSPSETCRINRVVPLVGTGTHLLVEAEHLTDGCSPDSLSILPSLAVRCPNGRCASGVSQEPSLSCCCVLQTGPRTVIVYPSRAWRRRDSWWTSYGSVVTLARPISWHIKLLVTKLPRLGLKKKGMLTLVEGRSGLQKVGQTSTYAVSPLSQVLARRASSSFSLAGEVL